MSIQFEIFKNIILLLQNSILKFCSILKIAVEAILFENSGGCPQ